MKNFSLPNRCVAVALLFAGACGVASAQSDGSVIPVKSIEGEFSLGFTYPWTKYNSGKRQVGAEMGLELRYNIPESKWDIGVLLNVNTTDYKFRHTTLTDNAHWNEDWSQIDWDADHSGHLTAESHNDVLSNSSFGIQLVADYNFGQGRRVNPFVGLGIGLGGNSSDDLDYCSTPDGSHFVMRPRVGVELFHHVRLSLSSNINRYGYNNLALSLGLVIGGRPKKAK